MSYHSGMMNRDEKSEYNRRDRIANKERIAARREARRAGLGDDTRRCSVPECDGVYDAQGYCARHYMAWKRNGDPTEVRQRQIHGKTVAERLTAYTRQSDACWEWTGARNLQGYGVLRVGESARLAHRITWELEHGKIPVGLVVLHRCDNPGCVRPGHLFLGTNADNVADMDAKGRRRSKPPKGSAHPKSKLTDEAVREIRGSPTMGRDLAIKYGVSQALISDVRKNRIWKHVK
jgi:hypothetical protein